jgi:hypothetical protein
VAIVLAAMFQPLVIANRYGQFGAFLLLGLVLTYRGLRDRNAVALTAGALLLFTKPQLFIVVAPAVLILLIRQRGWRLIAITAAALIAVAVVTTIRYPESLALFARGAGDRAAVFTTYSSTWAFAHFVSGDLWPVFGALFSAMVIASAYTAVRRLPEDLRLAGVISATALVSLAITPVDFHYDQVPLLLVVALAVALGRRFPQIALTWVVAAIIPWFVFFIELGISGPESPSLSGIVPLLMAALFWLVTRSSSPPTMASSPAIAKSR